MTDAGALLAAATAEFEPPRSATYRFQLGPSLGFEQVAALAGYLDALGITEAYLSPCFKCGPGSSHGYDVTDHNVLNPEIGSPASFDRMSETLRGRGMGIILDIVPNHMGVAGDGNPWWMDVLENGPSSPHASFFDIEWVPPKAELRDKVLLPVLPDQYGRVLESGQLQLELVDGAIVLRCAGARLPINPDSYARVLTYQLEDLSARLADDAPHLQELQSILTALAHLPSLTETDPARVQERLREKEVVKRRLGALVKESDEIHAFVEDNLRAFNGTVGDPASFDLLDALLSEQSYRLADWRVAGDEVNYRRFFDVNHLAAIRMERPEVFRASHELVLRLVGEGKVTGLRIDHPDGLYAPGEYFLRLQEGALLAVARRLEPELDAEEALAVAARYRAAAAADPASRDGRPFWIAAEKILMGDEPLPEWWPVAGTTGYDFLGSVNGLFVDRSTWRQMTTVYRRFAGPVESMADLAYVAKRLIMQVSMASEIAQLGLHLDRISERNRLSRDFTLASLVRAIREIIAAFPVYRTYVGDLLDEPSQRDRDYIDRAVAEARRRNPTVNTSIFDFLREALLMHHSERSDEQEREERRRFAMRFQQTTGPVTAKGVEDTALYIYNRLVALNEVGSDPARYGEAVSTFHEKNERRRERWPDSLLGTSTHDTKREEDGHSAPDRNDEYLLYQTLVGAWPVLPAEAAAEPLTARITAYMEKATKEAKRRTSWVNPDADYDRAVREFVTRILAADSPFRQVFLPFQRFVAVHGAMNSLAQTLLKIASPGIPDFYQGSELWDLSLVDPDNRKPVDFSARQQLLAGLRKQSPPWGELLADWRDGRIKLHVTERALTLRRELAGLFRSGAYLPLSAAGEHADHVVALARHDPGRAVMVVVPRLSARLTGFHGEWPLGS